MTLVATPIGNLEDLSPRAERVLREADQIYAEDTRHTGRLLARLQIKTRLRSCHDHNEEQRAREILEGLRAGEKIALVSDAGTPGIADPGFKVVRAALAAELEVSMIPGPSSVIMALVLSGFPSDRFVFDGWLPRRSGRLVRQLESYEREERTVVLLESSHRLLKSLPQFAKILGDRELAVCREMTKLHEEVRRGSAADLLAHFEEYPPKGELVLVLAPASA